jgi:hypothetical protein
VLGVTKLARAVISRPERTLTHNSMGRAYRRSALDPGLGGAVRLLFCPVTDRWLWPIALHRVGGGGLQQQPLLSFAAASASPQTYPR